MVAPLLLVESEKTYPAPVPPETLNVCVPAGSREMLEGETRTTGPLVTGAISATQTASPGGDAESNAPDVTSAPPTLPLGVASPPT
jgi:hypothetical protein